MKLLLLWAALTAFAAGANTQDSVATKSKLESKNGWESLKVACVARFKGKERLESITQRCVDMLNELRKNQFGIVPFSLDEISAYPKVRKGMTRAQLLKAFGKPQHVTDDGKFIYFNNKAFCQRDFIQDCYVFFSREYEGVSGWHGFKWEFTDTLRDKGGVAQREPADS